MKKVQIGIKGLFSYHLKVYESALHKGFFVFMDHLIVHERMIKLMPELLGISQFYFHWLFYLDH